MHEKSRKLQEIYKQMKADNILKEVRSEIQNHDENKHAHGRHDQYDLDHYPE